MNSASQQLLAAGHSVAQADICKDLLCQLIDVAQNNVSASLTSSSCSLNLETYLKDFISFGGGAIIASDVQSPTVNTDFISQFNQNFPIFYQTYDRSANYHRSDYLSSIINQFILKHTPESARGKGLCVRIPCDVSLQPASILFSFLILNKPWKHFDIDTKNIPFNDPTSGSYQQRPGFYIKDVPCGVGIYPKGIFVARLKVGKIRQSGSSCPLSAQWSRKLENVWDDGEDDDYCVRSDKDLFLNVFMYVDTQDMNEARLLKANGAKKNMLAKPFSGPMNLWKVSDLSSAVFDEGHGVLQQSLMHQLPLKSVKFSMPTVDIECSEDIDVSNAEKYGLSPDYFSKVISNLVTSDAYLDTVKCATRIRIDENGVGVFASASGFCTDGCSDTYNLTVDQPFCFALTNGNSVLARGVYI